MVYRGKALSVHGLVLIANLDYGYNIVFDPKVVSLFSKDIKTDRLINA